MTQGLYSHANCHWHDLFHRMQWCTSLYGRSRRAEDTKCQGTPIESLLDFFFPPLFFFPLLFFGCCVRPAMELTLTNSTLLQVAAITAKNSVDLLPSGSKKKVRACVLATVRMQCGVGRVWAVWAGWLAGGCVLNTHIPRSRCAPQSRPPPSCALSPPCAILPFHFGC